MNNTLTIPLKNPFAKVLIPFQRIKNFIFDLCKGSIIETVVLSTIVLIGSFFMQSITPVIPLVLLILGKNFFLRIASLSFKESILPFKNAMITLINFFMAANFALLFNSIAITLLHEIGHAVAAYTMYIDPSPFIKIFPFSGGETSYITDTLTPLGVFLGPAIANAIVSGAGSFVTLLFAFFLLFIANKKSSLSQLYAFLTTCAIYAIASDALYAHSAMNITSNGHDFASLWKVGIHPLFSAFFLLLAPFLFVFSCLKSKKKTLAKNYSQ